MKGELNDTFSIQYGRYAAPQTIKKNAVIPFKDHPQFAILIDILIRKYNHHAIITTDFSAKMYSSLLEAMQQYFTNDAIPQALRSAELIYLDIETKIRQKTLEKDFHNLRETLDTIDQYLLIVLTNTDLLTQEHLSDDDAFLRRQMETLLIHPKCRFLVLVNAKDYQPHRHLDDHFAVLPIAGPTESDVMTILKQQRTELENFHRVLIPEELLGQAYALAERYLSTHHTLEKALLLLDSSAARAGMIERTDNHSQFKPVLTTGVMTHVLSGWTQIPIPQLQLNKFKLAEFIQGMQQKVFGQDAAITVLGHELQQAQAHLQQTIGPFCSFLFAGPAHAGKETTALALVEQLFKQLNVLYIAQSASPTINSLADIKIQRCLDKRYLSLKEVIEQTPYAVIMFENIDQACPAILEGLQEILTTGYLHDAESNQYSFRQAIIILSTTLGTIRLAELTQTVSVEEETPEIDLMQLVMSEQKQEGFSETQQYSPHDLMEKIRPELVANLPALCQHLHVVPFVPLSKLAIEKIIRLKLKVLGKQLDKRYGIELGYAPEITRYLAHEVLAKQVMDHHVVDMDKALKQLYFSVEQAILSQADNKNRPNQLFLQLNETGQILRCDWLAMTDVRHHTS